MVKIKLTSVGSSVSATLDLQAYVSGVWQSVGSISLVDLVAGYIFIPIVGATAYQIVDTGMCGTNLEFICDSITTSTSSTSSTTSTSTTIPYGCNTLGNASNFLVLGASTVTNTGTSVVIGDLGLSPGSSVTGFPPGIITGTEHITDGDAANAQVSARDAFICLSALTPPTRLDADIGGTTVTPGVYDFASSAAITGTLTLNGGGDVDAVFVFQIPSTLTTATSAVVALTNSAQAGNVYWLVGSSATIGISTTMVGNIIADQSITMVTSAVLYGRAFALVAAVTLDTNVIIREDCSINPCDGIISTTTTSTSTISTTSTSTTISPTTTTTTTTTISPTTTTTTTTTISPTTTTTTTTTISPTTTTTTTTTI